MYCPECGHDQLRKKTKYPQRRWQCKNCGHRTRHPAKTPEPSQSNLDPSEAKRYSRFVITSAQNDTPLHQPFWQALRNYCEQHDAQMLVVPVRYKNPDSYHIAAQEGLTWPTEVLPYLCDTNLIINDNLAIMGEVKIAATAVNPLSGLDTLSGLRSAIFGHAQLQMRMVPTPKHKMPKQLHTTGSVSKQNYSRAKEGQKGRHHHNYAALIVEIEGSQFWIRQVEYRNGCFYDIDGKYTKDGCSFGHRASGLVLGDEHVRFYDEGVKRATFADHDSITATAKPQVLVRHDVLDFHTRSHHDRGDIIAQYEKHLEGQEDVEAELLEAAEHIDQTTPVGAENYIVSSNHHDHLRRWLNESNPKTDLKNLHFYHRMMASVCQARMNGDYREPFELFMADRLGAPVKWAGPNDELLIEGIDCSQHGDRGANGARGSKRAFANASYKMVAGHSHTPCIEKGFWQVGVSAPDLPYAKGLSSWMATHCLIYPNGGRSLVHIIKGKWRP